ncbi:MAG TPA: AsmA family protein [Terriglobales bacterium]|nr:AsmA family protein [Terriglobales bacterium]
MNLFQSKRRVWILATVLLISLFVVRPGANRFRQRLVRSIGLALGHPVEVQWVKLRILPRPGFDLENFVVHDDAAFSAEPMLRAQEVTAALRLRSLVRGRFEIGRLTFKEPSLNLVRGEDGHWNVESLLERAAKTPAAPTRNTLPEARPIFPYIEADNGRINFKIGAEKKAYALTDADFALWLESDNQWGMRLAAQPVRTDANISDTGLLRVSGTWQRSESLRTTPLQFTLQWEHGQLGQITKLLYGDDRGWRGELNLSSTLSGTPADLSVAADSSLDGFRRYDVVLPDSLRLKATCSAHYSSVEHALSAISCSSPVKRGLISVQGSILAPTGPRRYDLKLTAQAIPVQALLVFARHTKQGFPTGLAANGTLEGSLALQSVPDSGRLTLQGSGRTAALSLSSAQSNSELVLGDLPFSVSAQTFPSQNGRIANPFAPRKPELTLGPFSLALDKASELQVEAIGTRVGYDIGVRGEGSIRRLLQAAQTLELPTPKLVADGKAKLKLNIAGNWQGVASPAVTGTVQLQSVRAELLAANGAIEIGSADLLLTEDDIQVQRLTASAAGTKWTGSLNYARPCASLASCRIEFNLHADTIAADQLRDWLAPSSRRRAWYRFLSTPSVPVAGLLALVDGEGNISANKVVLGHVVANHASAKLDLHAREVRLSNVTAEIMGGKYRGAWHVNLAEDPPAIQSEGTLQRVALDQLASAMHDGWISGTGDFAFDFAATGRTMQDWLESGAGKLRFDMRHGTLPHLVIASASSPLQLRRFSGRLDLGSHMFELQDSEMETQTGTTYQVSGTVSPDQTLDIKLTGSPGGYNITGTLSAPQVLAVGGVETRAELKP